MGERLVCVWVGGGGDLKTTNNFISENPLHCMHGKQSLLDHSSKNFSWLVLIL